MKRIQATPSLHPLYYGHRNQTPLRPRRRARPPLRRKISASRKLILKNGEFKFALETCDSVYESLLESIAFQSISGKAATKIFSRIRALGANGVCPTPQQILATPVRSLREAGLSNAKAAAMHDLAQKTIDGVVPTLEAAHSLSDQELVERLVSVRGIGAWTVEMFLIFRLGRPDVPPIHDYGVQKGFALTYRPPSSPSRANSPNSANAGAPIAASPAGTCGAPWSTTDRNGKSPKPR